MATVAPNAFINSLSGTLGNTIFKRLRGKTIAANRPRPSQKQSEHQRANRSKFRNASAFAKAAMLDPMKKEYYWKKAKKLKLPNAYTAAITDYMRSPVVTIMNRKQNGDVIASVNKRDFRITKVEVYRKDQATQVPVFIRAVMSARYDEWVVCLTADEIAAEVYLRMEDEPGNKWTITPLVSKQE